MTQPVADIALVTSLDQPTLFVGGGDAVSTITLGDGGPQVSDPLTLPGPVSTVVWNESANLVHVATTTASGEPTVAVLEPNGLTLFADAVVPFTPSVLAVQDQPDVPERPCGCWPSRATAPPRPSTQVPTRGPGGCPACSRERSPCSACTCWPGSCRVDARSVWPWPASPCWMA